MAESAPTDPLHHVALEEGFLRRRTLSELLDVLKGAYSQEDLDLGGPAHRVRVCELALLISLVEDVERLQLAGAKETS